jgi:hypothetical protein
MRLIASILIFSFALAPLACKSREEVLAAAEAEGKLLAEKKARLAKGVGEALKGEGATAAEALTEGTGKVLNSAGRGIEKGLDDVEVTIGADLVEQKVKAERGARHREAQVPTIKVYLVNDAPFKGTLQLLAKDANGKEIGRARLAVDEAAPNGKNVLFEFDKLTDLNLATKLELSSIASAVTPPPK